MEMCHLKMEMCHLKMEMCHLKIRIFNFLYILQRSVTVFPHFHFTCYKNLHNFFFNSVDIIVADYFLVGYFFFYL